MIRSVTATKLAAKLLSLLDDLTEGEEAEITKHGRVVARLIGARRPRAEQGRLEGVAATRQGECGRKPGTRQGAVPLRPRRCGLVGEVPRLDGGASLPAAVGGIGRLVERIAAVGDVADEDVVDGARVHVERRHL